MIELPPYSPTASSSAGMMDAITDSASTEEQVKTANAMGKFSQQGGVVWKITGPYMIGWTLAAIVLTVGLISIQGGLFIVGCLLAPFGYMAVFVWGARTWQNKISQLMDFPKMLSERDHARLGEVFTVKYRHRFKQETTIEELKVQFVKREWVRYTEGTSTYTVNRDIVLGEHWWDMVDVAAGETVEREMTFSLPDYAMHTWTSANNNRITYLFKLTVDLPGWLDYQDTYGIVVPPEVVVEGGSDV